MLVDNGELVFKRAALYSNLTYGSDKLKVRVLPDQVGVPAEDLPIYPMFDKTEVIHGVAEEDTHDTNLSTLLWVLVTPDNLNGFIFSEANVDSYIYEPNEQTPWPYKDFRKHIQLMNLNINCFNYAELRVLYSTQPYFYKFHSADIKNKFGVGTGFTLDIINIRTGERWWMNSSGSCIYFGQRKIESRVGSPGLEHSTIIQQPSDVTIKAKNITLDAEHLCLGHHGMHLPGMQGLIPDNTKGGMAIVPLMDITV